MNMLPPPSDFRKYYHSAPWLGLLRYLEVEQSKKAADLCASPVLDLGCGDGFVASQVLQGHNCVGVDIDKDPLLLAHSGGVYRLVLNADARRLPFKDQIFGTVYSNGAMEHMNTLKTVITEIHRILKKGGYLVSLVPSDKFQQPVGVIAKLLGSHLWNCFNTFQKHLNLLSSEQWRSQLDTAGFSVKSIDSYGGEEFAITLSLYDLFSKLHLQPRRPFFTLKHRGNMGNVLLRFLKIFKPLHVEKESTSDSKRDFLWLMIVAYRPK